MRVETVVDPADPRLDDYRDLPERRLRESGGLFVAESEVVVRRLLASPLAVRSILLTAPRLAALEPALGGRDVVVLLVPQHVMDGVAGFHVHRGCLAVGERPAQAAVPDGARAVVVLEDLADVDNVGALVRCAAAFGAEAVVLSPGCADPFYRKAIRVSAGSVFTTPLVRCARWPGDLAPLRARGLTLVGAVVDPAATPLPRFRAPDRFALLLGAEGPGLSAAARAACDALVTIPMDAGADSLNVAVAGAVFLYALTRAGARGAGHAGAGGA